MSAEHVRSGWRRWREAVFATCTVWLVLQNLALVAIVAIAKPASALAAGAAVARTAFTLGGQLTLAVLAVGAGLALAAYLVHAPSAHAASEGQEVDDARG